MSCFNTSGIVSIFPTFVVRILGIVSFCNLQYRPPLLMSCQPYSTAVGTYIDYAHQSDCGCANYNEVYEYN